MRRHRSFHKTFGFVAVTLGAAVVPATVRATAGDDAGTATDQGVEAPAEPAAPAPEPQPEAEPQPEPEREPEAEPEPDSAPTTPPTTEPQPANDPLVEPTTPAPTEASPAPAIETELPAPSSDPAVEAAAPDEQPAQDDESAEAAGIDGITRTIAFPVMGPVQYSNDFGACRDGCARHHQGTDIVGVRMQPLLAAVDGTVTTISLDDHGISGDTIRVTGDDGWYYNYFHVNNDTPGTDDDHAVPAWRLVPGLTVGSRVRAGQVIGYMGDSGNAEASVPHLHFEIRTPDRTPVNPYLSLVAAQDHETCVPNTAWTNTALEALSPSAVAVIPLAGGGRWVIDVEGRLHAEGPAAGEHCATAQPLPPVDTPIAAVPSPTTPAAPVAPEGIAPAPAPTGERWTVEPGDTLWHIVQRTYGTTDVGATVALVGFVFDNNREVLTDSSVLEVGMQLVLPPFGA